MKGRGYQIDLSTEKTTLWKPSFIRANKVLIIEEFWWRLHRFFRDGLTVVWVSQMFTIQKTEEEGESYLFNCFLQFPFASQTLRR